MRAPSDTTPNTAVTYRFQNGELIYNNGVGDETLARYVNVANSSFVINGSLVTTTIVTTTQGESVRLQSAATARLLP